MKQIVVFTDLDGTLIDHDTYDFKEAKPALDQLRSRAYGP
jgi:mannosyl-3-phosphoglycerate phosphatase